MAAMTSALLLSGFGLLVVLQLPTLGGTTATVTIRFKTFRNPNGRDWYGENCDLFVNTRCDNVFTFCIDRRNGDNDAGHCNYAKFRSGEFSNMADITFDHDIRGVANPIRLKLNRWQGLKLKVKVEDDDSSHSGHDLVDLFYHTYNADPGYNGTWSVSLTPVLRGRRTNTQATSLTVEFKVKCDKYFYGSDCRRKCQYRDDNRGHYTCNESGYKQCLPGWENLSNSCRNFSDDCVGHQCQNGAICIDGVGRYTCSCPVGYTGARCQKNIDDCTPNPCQHGASCTDGLAGFQCACPPEYPAQLSATCDIHTCNNSNPCRNGATCYGDGRCLCPPNYTGERCDLHFCEMNCVMCQNGGSCNGTACVCPPGTLGASCEVLLCDHLPCVNGGVCEQGVCVCPPGYTGLYCHEDVDDCASFPCRNDGLCVDGPNTYTCVCRGGYDGPQCRSSTETEPPEPVKRTTSSPNDINRVDFSKGGGPVVDAVRTRSQPMFVALILVIVLLLVVVLILLGVICCDRLKRRRAKASENGTLPVGNYDNPLYTAPGERHLATDDASYLRPVGGATGSGPVLLNNDKGAGAVEADPHYQVPPAQRNAGRPGAGVPGDTGPGAGLYDRPRPHADLPNPPPYSRHIDTDGAISMRDLQVQLEGEPHYEDLNNFSKTPLP